MMWTMNGFPNMPYALRDPVRRLLVKDGTKIPRLPARTLNNSILYETIREINKITAHEFETFREEDDEIINAEFNDDHKFRPLKFVLIINYSYLFLFFPPADKVRFEIIDGDLHVHFLNLNLNFVMFHSFAYDRL